MSECGADMGGIWIPHPNGGEHIYLRLRCNKPKDHENNYNVADAPQHAYLDPKGGMLVKQVLAPKVIVTKDRIGRI